LAYHFVDDLGFNPCGESDQLIFQFDFAKKRKAKQRVKNKNLKYFDAKLRFTLLASLRSAIFSEIKLNNKLVTTRKG